MYRFMTTIKNVTEEKEKKKLKSSIGFLSANKIDKYNREEKKRKNKSKRICRTSQKIRIINVFPEPLLSESFPVLGLTVPSNTVLISGQLRF